MMITPSECERCHTAAAVAAAAAVVAAAAAVTLAVVASMFSRSLLQGCEMRDTAVLQLHTLQLQNGECVQYKE
jgi:hypothetical protein